AAERRIFNLLKYDPDASQWTVLHSLGLSRRGSKPFGEIDFVVVVPDGGVFCLEVKGGGVSCHDGIWRTVNREGSVITMKRSPFAQAVDGFFALRDTVLDRAPVGFPPDLVFGYAVVMPDISFSAQAPEWEKWQVIDRDTLRRPISHAIRNLANQQRR